MTLVEFFHAVHSDQKSRADLAGLYDEMIAEYGLDLTQRQVSAVRRGDAFEISKLILAENEGAEPNMAHIVIWMISPPGVIDNQ
jgi:hypothetical protein